MPVVIISAAALTAFAIWWASIGSLGAVILFLIERRDAARQRRMLATLEERARQARATLAARLAAFDADARNLDTPCTCSRCARLPVDQRGH
jgi:hypothetical protein